MGDPAQMIELLELLLTTLSRVFRSRKRLILETCSYASSFKSPSGANAGPDFAPETHSSGCSAVTSSGLATPSPPCPARDCAALAWPGLALVLALAIRPAARAATAERRGPVADRHDQAREPTLGTERIRGELLKLGISVSARSIRRYRRRGPARPPSQSWRTFLSNHARLSGQQTCWWSRP